MCVIGRPFCLQKVSTLPLEYPDGKKCPVPSSTAIIYSPVEMHASTNHVNQLITIER